MADRAARGLAAFNLTSLDLTPIDTPADAVEAVRQHSEWAEAHRPSVAAELAEPIPPFALQPRGVLTRGHVTGDPTTLHQDPYYSVSWWGGTFEAVGCGSAVHVLSAGRSSSLAPNGDPRPVVNAVAEFLGEVLDRKIGRVRSAR